MYTTILQSICQNCNEKPINISIRVHSVPLSDWVVPVMQLALKYDILDYNPI